MPPTSRACPVPRHGDRDGDTGIGTAPSWCWPNCWGRFPRLQLIWADAGYAGRLVDWVWETGGWLLTVVKRKPDTHHFEVLPRRWVVERTLAWLSRCRRLSKDYEERTESSEAWVHVAMVNLMLKRLQPS